MQYTELESLYTRGAFVTYDEMKEKLSRRLVHFCYRKKDGSRREAYGTTNGEVIDNYLVTEPSAKPSSRRRVHVGENDEKEGIIRYFDATAEDGHGHVGAFRMFYIATLLWVDELDV